MTPVRPERPWPRSGARTGRVFEACNGRLPDEDGMEQVLIWSMNFCWQWADGVYWPTFNLIQPVGQDELAARSCHPPLSLVSDCQGDFHRHRHACHRPLCHLVSVLPHRAYYTEHQNDLFINLRWILVGMLLWKKKALNIAMRSCIIIVVLLFIVALKHSSFDAER